MPGADLKTKLWLYETALFNTPDFVYIFDLNHRFIYANPALLTTWGRTPEDAIGKNCLELGYEPWHAQMHDKEIEEVVRTKKPIRGDVAFTGTSGKRIYDYIFSPVLNDAGDVIAVAGTTRDVTERKQIEEALRISEETRELALKASEFIGTFDWDMQTNLMVSDERFARLYLVDPKWAAKGAPLEEYTKTIHPEDLARVGPAIEHTAKHGGEYAQEYRLVQADNSVRWVVARGRADGNHFSGAVIDITDRKIAEEKVTKQRRTYETVLENSADFNYVFDLEGRFSYSNKALADLLQTSSDEMVGKNFFDLGYPAPLAERLQNQIQQVIRTKESVRDETPYTSAFGTRAYEYIFTPITGENGVVEGVAGATRDITDYKEANRRKDEFLAMLAHELRNPLAPISNSIHILKSSAVSDKIREEAAMLVDRQII
jgi:PAS domain S-box-containing protein